MPSPNSIDGDAPPTAISVDCSGVDSSIADALECHILAIGMVVSSPGAASASVILRDIRTLEDKRPGLRPCVAVLTDPKDADKALALGAVDFIVWPRDRDVLQTRLRVNAQRRSRHPLLLDIVAQLPDVFFRSTTAGIILECYPEDGFFVPPSEFIGQHFSTIIPEDAAKSFQTGFVALASGAPFVQVRYSLPEGPLLQPYEARMFLDGTGQVLTVSRAAPSFAPLGLTDGSSDGLFRSVFDASAIGISVAARGGALIETNTAFREMLGYSEDEVRGRHYLEFCHPEDAELDAVSRRELHNGQRDSYRVAKRYLTKDGRTLWT
ncbi:MAG: PAS domain S-box-containing protein, partial [Myxococcota bacterium]